MGLDNGIKTALNEANCSEGGRQESPSLKNNACEDAFETALLALPADDRAGNRADDCARSRADDCAGNRADVLDTASKPAPLSLCAMEQSGNGLCDTAEAGGTTVPDADGCGLVPGDWGKECQNLSLRQAPEESQQLCLIDVEAPARGAGRPKGAKNKSTKQWVEYFLAVCDSPMVALGKMYSENTAALASRLHCKDIEAFKVQAAAATALLPYIHQKQPTLIDTADNTLPLIQLTVSQTVYNEVVADNGGLKDEFAGVEILDLPTSEFEEIIEDEQNCDKTNS